MKEVLLNIALFRGLADRAMLFAFCKMGELNAFDLRLHAMLGYLWDAPRPVSEQDGVRSDKNRKDP